MLLDIELSLSGSFFLKLISQRLQCRREWVRRGLRREWGCGGVIWLREVTMRYGREEGRLFDTATCWGCAVIYNGNTSELGESSMACKNHTHMHRELHLD